MKRGAPSCVCACVCATRYVCACVCDKVRTGTRGTYQTGLQCVCVRQGEDWYKGDIPDWSTVCVRQGEDWYKGDIPDWSTVCVRQGEDWYKGDIPDWSTAYRATAMLTT